MARLTVVDHPLVAHRLSLLRDRTTPPELFRDLVRGLALLLGYEALRDLPTEMRRIDTPVAPTEAAFLRDFAGDLPEAKAKVLFAVQEPFHKALLTGKTAHAAWRSKPSFYAVSTEDRTINPDLERFMAKRMGAKTIEVKASHLALISQPDAIAGLILEAAGKRA